VVIISRADAKAQGLKRYFDGSACLRGHVAERGTSNAECVECARERGREAKRRLRASPEGRNHLNALNSESRERHKDEINSRERAAHAKDPQRNRDSNKRSRDKDPERNRAWKRNDQEKNAETHRAWSLKANYGLPLEVYDYAIIKQLNLCAICKEPEATVEKSGKLRRLAVDHCHDTDEVRGFLCGKCNKAIGLMQDSSANLRAAADYLDAARQHARLSPAIARRLQIPIPD
jgi:Recombination endonuclease VII